MENGRIRNVDAFITKASKTAAADLAYEGSCDDDAGGGNATDGYVSDAAGGYVSAVGGYVSNATDGYVSAAAGGWSAQLAATSTQSELMAKAALSSLKANATKANT